MAILKEGAKAPEFNLPASNGENVTLKDFKGKKRIILYFYPRDNTPGCTTEACGFRDSIKAIERKDAVVIGISPDGLSSHNKFIEKFNLPFYSSVMKKKRPVKTMGYGLRRGCTEKNTW